MGMSKHLGTKGFSMVMRLRAGRFVPAAPLGALVATAVPLFGCRTSTDDIERWTTTSQGPRKLVAVLTHDKYPIELRVEAAMALVRMAPRNGRRTGILGSDDYPGLVDALESMPPAERAKIVSAMVPAVMGATVWTMARASRRCQGSASRIS